MLPEPTVFVYNPQLGGEEDSEKKILFFHPSATPLRDQVSSVGLCEAVAAFSNTFCLDGGESVHTEKGRMLSWQCEPSLWIVLSMPHEPPATVSKPTTATAVAAAAAAKLLGASSSSPLKLPGSSPRDGHDSASGGKDGNGSYGDELPAHEEALQDVCLEALLRRIYSALRLACGPLCAVLEARGADGLRALLSEVLPLLLQVILPAGEEDARRIDLLDATEGMRFLPVDRRVYLKVQYVLNVLLTQHPCIRYTMVLHGSIQRQC